MEQLITYLTFDGRCREAMEFYQECLGGELYFQTLGESLFTNRFPTAMENFILQASLKSESLILMATDMAENELLRGNNISILLNCGEIIKTRIYFKRLQKGGEATYPLQKTHCGDLFGGLTDRYGIQWIFYCKRSC